MAHPGPDHENSDQRTSAATQDPNSMTIEFLRARLLAERAVSKSAKEKVDELAEKVEELEEQLKFVSLQRKKAEKATADILAILEENGFTDVSESYDSSSDHESFSQTNSAPGRRISWKGLRSEPNSSDKVKESRTRRQKSFESVHLHSPRPRQGKSCRQIRRRESRSVVEDYKRDGNLLDHQESIINNSEFQESIIDNAADLKEDGNQQKVPSSYCLEKENNMDINLKRALENRAHVIGCFEDMERTQREWEEKFRESNISTLDLCDPGNHSDVTDESSERKTEVQRQGATVVPSVNEARSIPNVVDSVESFQIPSHVSPGNSITSQDKQCQTYLSKSVDQGISSQGGTSKYNPDSPKSECSRSQICSSGFFEHSSSPNLSALVSQPNLGSRYYCSDASVIEKGAYPLVSVAQENSSAYDTVLLRLREARLSLQEKVNSPHLSKAGYLSEGLCSSAPAIRINTCTLPPEPVFGTNTPHSASKVGFMPEVPVGCAGLFRVPTDFSSDSSMRNSFLASSSHKNLISHIPERDIPLFPRDHLFSEISTKSLPSSGSQSHLLDTGALVTMGERLPTTPYIGGSKLWTGFGTSDDPLIDVAQRLRLYKSTPSVSDSHISCATSTWEGNRTSPTSFSLDIRPNTYAGTANVHPPSTASRSAYRDPTQLGIERFSVPYATSSAGLPPIDILGDNNFRRVVSRW